jgi:hypothetical protein
MLEIYAAEYLRIGMEIQSISGLFSARLIPDDRLADKDSAAVRDALGRILRQALALNLPVTINSIGRLMGSYDRSLPSYGQVKNDIANVGELVKVELGALRFFFMPPERAIYYSDPPGTDWLEEPTDGLGEGLAPMRDVIKAFPSAEEELREAGKCFAFGRFTACVFHSMRVLEFGLASLATALNVRITNPNWHQVLIACENEIKTLSAHGPDSKANEMFYNTAALEFRHFKPLRNDTAHSRKLYSESEARTVLDHVASFMRHLSTRISEVPLP